MVDCINGLIPGFGGILFQVSSSILSSHLHFQLILHYWGISLNPKPRTWLPFSFLFSLYNSYVALYGVFQVGPAKWQVDESRPGIPVDFPEFLVFASHSVEVSLAARRGPFLASPRKRTVEIAMYMYFGDPRTCRVRGAC